LAQICFATQNQHKLSEILVLLKDHYQVLGLTDIGCTTDIPETGSTLIENAAIKAKFVQDNYNIDCFADDTGLEIDALNGAPGVYSARYAGEPSDSKKNIDMVLDNMADNNGRAARFKTVIALIIGSDMHYFEGTVEGSILKERHGEAGFGYDPIFQPKGYTKSFAEMTLEEKNKISHRGFAVRKLVAFLQHQNK
jgi:XTP/dITP diphosphohydrolase